jgi:hypothetical protein
VAAVVPVEQEVVIQEMVVLVFRSQLLDHQLHHQ